MLPLLLTIAVQIGLGGLAASCDDCTVRLLLSADKPTYEAGEPIPLSVELINSGRTSIMVSQTSDATGRHDGYRFDVFDERGRRMRDPGAASVSLVESIGGYQSLHPGAHQSRQYLLNYHVEPLRPGQYVVRARFASELVRRGFAIESNPISVTIVAMSPGRMRQRIDDLVAGAPATSAALLGFTGDPAAVPAVIDLVYSSDDQIASRGIDALLYFDPAIVQPALLDALRRRGPRDRMIWFLVVRLDAPPAEVQPVLLAALKAPDADARAAAVEGLRLSNSASEPSLFAPLAAMLADPDPRARQRAASAVGHYRNQQALDVLRPAVRDPDPEVSEQATIAVGWVATAAGEGSKTRDDAIEVLRETAAGAYPGSARQAKYWLTQVAPK